MTNIAVVYYSLMGETIAPGMKIVNLKKGHTAADCGPTTSTCNTM